MSKHLLAGIGIGGITSAPALFLLLGSYGWIPLILYLFIVISAFFYEEDDQKIQGGAP